jgi:hypothetical protein
MVTNPRPDEAQKGRHARRGLSINQWTIIVIPALLVVIAYLTGNAKSNRIESQRCPLSIGTAPGPQLFS